MLEFLIIFVVALFLWFIYELRLEAKKSPETKARDARIAARLAARLKEDKFKREKKEIEQHEHEFRLERARKARLWWR